MKQPWIVCLLSPLAIACTASDAATGAGPDTASTEIAVESPDHHGSPELPVAQLEQIVGAPGEVSSGVLDISVARPDIGEVTGPLGVTFTPAFEVHGEVRFQPLGHGRALLNGDMALREDETDPFIAALLAGGLVFQAFHQHAPTHPQIWFVHFHGIGEPLALAHKIRAAIDVTHTPLPQQTPIDPRTPLDPARLAHILHGHAHVGDQGVVSVTIDRSDTVRLDGVVVSPAAGISTTVELKPLGGANAEVVPDFSMTASEVTPVVKRMVELQWAQGCLYNQEIGEQPQLFFDHMVKVGDAYQLAHEIRAGLDRTHAE